MADIRQILSLIVSGLTDTLVSCGFKAVIPAGCAQGDLPATVSGDKITINFAGEGKALRIEHFDNKITLLCAEREGEILDGDFSVLVPASLLDPEQADAKDVKYFVNDYSDEIGKRFAPGAAKKPNQKTKLPPTVTKAAAKSGMQSYDANTLANRLTLIYTEIREEYIKNCDKYGQFLPEEFFQNYGTPVIIETIRRNDPKEMKKLFNVLNEIYDDGTNDIQSLIAVSILGSLDNDQQLLANCVDYMSDMLCPTVIKVNKYLASNGGKGAKMRLDNPPKYKPKKQKKSFLGSNLNQR